MSFGQLFFYGTVLPSLLNIFTDYLKSLFERKKGFISFKSFIYLNFLKYAPKTGFEISSDLKTGFKNWNRSTIFRPILNFVRIIQIEFFIP
ncbi:hypothetical protein BpHYR1_039954 [Brachionus plicatilis]|uniref:Uncharacterized protein n=1 Tax=Brachionus plicatilis TaxID=10195 RepID=A0A3M7PBW8_BRAPC|nr:hypothetical protein BpHYR1_039954 [Brachionus plicatilis]